MKGLSSGAKVSLKQAIRYQTGLNSGSVFDYYYRHYNVSMLNTDGEIHSMYMQLGFTPKDLILMNKTFLD